MNATSQKLAHWFILKSKEEAKPLTPVKLMKLAVCACYEYLHLYKEPLLNESLEARETGPVVPSLYHEYKDKGGNEFIENPSRRQTPLEPDEDLENFLNRIWKEYGKYTGRQLDRITRQAKSPWALTLAQSRGTRATISDETIVEYYDSIHPAGFDS